MVAATITQPEQTSQKLGDVLLTWDEVCGELRTSESTIRRWIREADFPAPLQIGPRAVRFSARAIRGWLQNIYDAVDEDSVITHNPGEPG